MFFHSVSWTHFYYVFQIKALINLRYFCENNAQLKADKSATELILNAEEWSALERLMTVLEPFQKYTVKLQSESCTLSDFFGYWTILRMKTSKYASTENIAVALLSEMDSRERVLLENPLMMACVFLDPRYQRTLSNDQKSLAICFLKNLHMKLRSIRNVPSAPSDHEDTTTSNSSVDELEAFLDAMQNDSHNQTTVPIDESAQGVRIEGILNQFYGAREDMKINLIDYWEKKKDSDPELYDLANAIYSIPPTQATVERCFSAMAIILTQRRTQLGDNILEHILIIRLNPELRQK